jgi:Ion transport protein.
MDPNITRPGGEDTLHVSEDLLYIEEYDPDKDYKSDGNRFDQDPIESTSYLHEPLQRGLLQRDPFQNEPLQRDPFQQEPFQHEPFQLQSSYQESSYQESLQEPFRQSKTFNPFTERPERLHLKPQRPTLTIPQSSSSIPQRPSPTTPHSRSFIDDATDDSDFDAIKEGLNFALGTSSKDPKWFPVNKVVSSEAISEPIRTPTPDYTNNIPMHVLSKTGHQQSHKGSISPSHLSPFYGELKSAKTPENQNFSDLESGMSKSPSKDLSNSPAKFTTMLSRVSDRIAGEGVSSSPATPNPNSNFLTADESPKKPALSPLSGKFSLFRDEDSIHDSNSLPFSNKYNPASSSEPSLKSIPNVTINDENTSTAYSNFVQQGRTQDTDGLGLYIERDNNLTPESTKTNEPINPFSNNTTHPVSENEPHVDDHAYADPMYLHLFGKSLKIFPPESKTRRLCHKIISHKSINSILLGLLILQIMLLAYRQWNPLKLGGYISLGNNWADVLLLIINCFYTLEIIAKVVAYGIYDDKIMFEELGLPYPEMEEENNQYFNYNYVRLFFKSLGLTKFGKHSTTPQLNRNDSETTDENRNSSDEVDVKENFEIQPDRKGQLHALSRKYRDLNLHHKKKKVNFYLEDEYQSIGLTEASAPKSKLAEKSNTLLLPPKKSNIDVLDLKRAYLKNNWHRIDFLSMIFFWISLLLSIDRYDAKHQIMIFRALSCLRILRFCNLTTGTSTILLSCKVALPQLIDVAIFISFFWLFFGIIGVQSFKSSLTRQCVWTNPNDPEDTFIHSMQFCGSYIGLDGTAQPYINRDGLPSSVIKGFRCPMYSKCISGDNPYNGTVNFDNILQSMEIVFVIMSANTFTDIMYYTMDSDNLGACLFFIFCIFIMTVWLTNVFVAVIVASFNIMRKEAVKERKASKILRMFPEEMHEFSLHKDRINLLKKQNIFLKYYYNLEFIFPIVIMMNLFVQCFRDHNMSDTRRHIIFRLEVAFTVVFFVEILLRLALHFPNWRMFFISKRNSFDLFLGVITLIIVINPIKEKLGHAYYWLTVFQIIRFYRVVLAMPITRSLWLKIMGNFRAIYDLALFYFILTFLASIIVARYFEGFIAEDMFDDVDFPVQTLPNAFIALYVITSTENWTDIMYALQENATTTSARSFGAVLLIFWFFLSNMIILNIFIAVIAKSLEVSEDGKRKEQLLQFIDNMTDRLHKMDTETGMLSRLKRKLFRKKGLKDELERAVVNLLLSGTAVNDFLDTSVSQKTTQDDLVMNLPSSGWKRWLHVNFWRTSNFLKNPFYSTKKQEKKLVLENFDPALFARNVISERNVLINQQNDFLKENPNFNNVFYVMGPRHRLRRLCQRLVKSSHGERIDGIEPYKPISETIVVIMFLATISLVVTGCYSTPLYRKEIVASHGNFNWTFYIEVGFVGIFTTEFLIKIIADGLIFTPNAYARSSWNIIDFIVLVGLWIEFIAFLRDNSSLSRIVRGLKALRALRLLTISETAKNNFHNTMISGFWKIISAAVISLCLLFPFSIWGLNILNGRLGYCLDGQSTLAECINEYQNEVFDWNVMSPNVYTNPELEFNNFSSSFSALFEIVSLEGWVDLLLNVMKSTGVGTPQQNYASPINGFFVIFFNFISIIFILTLFVSVIISNYSKSTGRAYQTREQITWYQVKKILIQVNPSRRKDLHSLSKFRRFCYSMTVERNVFWSNTLNFVLFMHVVGLLLECFPSNYVLDIMRIVILIISTSCFLINANMLLVGQGFKTFMGYKWNIFNLTVSAGAFVTTLIGIFVDPSSVFLNINKLFLVGILAFVIPRSNRLSQLLRFASASLPQILSFSFTWAVVFLVYAIALNQIFGLTKIGPNGTGNLNLRSVPKALIVLFRSSFGEGWNYVMDDYKLEAPFCTVGTSIYDTDCGSKPYAYILFISWNIISMYIFVNMFVSLILDSFSFVEHGLDYSKLIQREEIRKFKRAWQKLDPQGSGYIKPIELPKLLHSLDGALSFHFYLGSMKISALCKKWFSINNPNDPYDILVNYALIEDTLSKMDIPKIRERRQHYEMFIEEALLNMELNDDPGISFTRILLQLPLYTTFDSGQCLNLIDFLERRLLVQKVEKRMKTKRVYETIAAYACRWKYRKDQRLGIHDTNIAFDSQLKRQSYLSNETLGANAPSIFVTEPVNNEYRTSQESRELMAGSELMTGSELMAGSELMTGSSYRDYYSEDAFVDDETSPLKKDDTSRSEVYVPKSPLSVFRTRKRGTGTEPSTESTDVPKLYIEIPKQSPRLGSPTTKSDDDIHVSPFLDSTEVLAHESDKNVSLIDLSTLGEIVENSSWGEALRQVKSDQNSESDRDHME